MVHLESWSRCVLLLLMYLAVYQCIMIQPLIPEEETVDMKNRSSSLSQKQICDNITRLLAGPKNKSTEIVSMCAQGVPSEFPQVGPNGTKVLTADKMQDTLHLDNTMDNSNQDIAKEEPVKTNTSTKTEVKSNITNMRSNSSVYETYAQNQTAAASSPVLNSTTNSTDHGEIKVPVEFPQIGPNGTKLLTAGAKQDTLNLNDTTNKREVKSNITNINGDNLNVNTTDMKSNSSDDSSNKANVAQVPLNDTASNSSKIDTEVSDLLNSTINCLSPNQIPESPPNVTFNATQPIDRDTELIEDGQNTEDVLRNSSSYEDKLSRAGVPLIQGQLAAILAGVFVIIAVTAYVGLLSWRRYLENRYGSRQMLVNEDEFNDDLRHFSI